MAKKDLEKQVEEDLEAYLTTGFNNLLDGIMQQLGREGASEEEVASPVWTGFFASSWKVAKSRPRPTHKVEDYEPWATIKKEKRRRFPGFTPRIEPRFDIPSFTSDDTIFIGNTTKYARYALERPSQIVAYLGGIKAIASTIFNAKDGISLRVAGSGTARGSRYQRIL